MKEWQSRPLAGLYPIVFFDALVLKVRDEGRILNKAAYLAIGIGMDGLKEVLGIWIEKNEGAKFWLGVFTELKNRGLTDVLIACVDGLKGLPEAIETVFPQTEVQLCIVHMVRNSLKFVSYKDRKKIADDLKTVYRSATVEQAEEALTEFEGNGNPVSDDREILAGQLAAVIRSSHIPRQSGKSSTPPMPSNP